MALRHKAVKATLDHGYASEWNDDHNIDYADEIYHEEAVPALAVSSRFDTGQTAGGSAPVWTLVGSAGLQHAHIVMNTGGTTNNVSSMRLMLGGAASDVTSIADYPVLTFTMNIAAVHTTGKVVEAGLIPSATALFTANQDGAFFRVNNNKIYSVTGNGTNETETDLGAFDAFAQYRIEFASVGGVNKVYFFIDDMVTPAATHTTYLPDANMTLKFSVISANNVDSTVRMDAIAWKRNRATA